MTDDLWCEEAGKIDRVVLGLKPSPASLFLDLKAIKSLALTSQKLISKSAAQSELVDNIIKKLLKM